MVDLMRRLRFKREQTGISLPEVLVSLSIFAIVGVTIVAALGTNFRVLTVADQRTTAESLAKTQLEAINNAPYDFTVPYVYNKITNIPAGYDIAIAVLLINPETGAVSATDLGVQKITVTVTCQQHSPPEIIVVETYKR